MYLVIAKIVWIVSYITIIWITNSLTFNKGKLYFTNIVIPMYDDEEEELTLLDVIRDEEFGRALVVILTLIGVHLIIAPIIAFVIGMLWPASFILVISIGFILKIRHK